MFVQIFMKNQQDCLVVHKNKQCKIQTKPFSKEEDARGRSLKCYGVLGIVNIQGHDYLVTIANRAFAAKLPDGVSIFEVHSIHMHGFDSSSVNNLEMNPKLKKAKEDFEKLFNGNTGQGTGFYFSYNADLSISQQEKFKRQQANQLNNGNLMKKPEFVWNYDILKDFTLQRVPS